MGRKQCRLWWPEQLSDPRSDLLLFGWVMDSANSVDVVVALAAPAAEISAKLHQSDLLQEMLGSVNSKLPASLQEASTFAMIGLCAAASFQGSDDNYVAKDVGCGNVDGISGECSVDVAACGCETDDQSVERLRKLLTRNGYWIHLFHKSRRILHNKESRWIPEFHHMHHHRLVFHNCDAHLIVYDPPAYGRHHFSASAWGHGELAITPSKKPYWFRKLDRRSATPDLELVISALNCAGAVMVFFEGISVGKTHGISFNLVSRLSNMLWHAFAVSVASMSAILYIALQLFHGLLSRGSHTVFTMMLQKVFAQTWKNVQVRSCQYLYWPSFLLSSGSREETIVEYAHMAALRRHSVWSGIAIDLLMGTAFGVLMLVNVDSIYFVALFIARNATDNILRSGCVWLMDVPAGFKLNTELAEVLGMVSLHAIQVFSTLLFFLGSLFWHFIRGLALTGIIFGLTVPAALIVDMIKVATLHIRTLHWLMSFVYSRQIQALVALWRLFRGRKWNPLRQRLDSYDYSVEQHVVGSLLFTPLLLLLPTTSVFYIFFTVLNTTICFICIVIEVGISVLHTTPCAEILLWVVRRRRFPSGIWFEVISDCPRSDQWVTGDTTPWAVVSFLCSNYATIGQILATSYRNLFQRLGASIGTSSAYGVLSGQRTPSTLQMDLQPALPWMQISCKDYWRLCYSSVLACGPLYSGEPLQSAYLKNITAEFKI